MAHSTLIRANIAGLHYVHTLAAAYQRFLWITDPDYAHQNDQEAWAKVRRDAVLYHAIARRRSAAAGSEWNVAPASRSAEDSRAAEVVTDLLTQIERFDQARQMQAEAIFRGSAWQYVCGRRRTLRVAKDAPRTWWVPERLQHVDRWRFRISRDPEDMVAPAGKIHTRWEMFDLSKRAWDPLEHPEWFVRTTWEDLEETLGYGRGLLHAIYFYWRAKEIVLTQGLAGLERWAQGLIQVGIDGARQGSETRTNDAIVDEWIEQLSKTRTEHVIVGDKNDEIKIHQGGGEGHQMVIGMLEYLDRALDRLILSSTLPTGGGSSDKGSYSRAKIEEEQAEATFVSDRHALSEDYQRDLVTLVWRLNRAPLAELLAAEGLPPTARMPRFELIWPRREDPKDAVAVAAQALQAGIKLKAEEVYERIGYTRPDAGDEVLEGPAGGGGMPPAGGAGSPFGFRESRRRDEAISWPASGRMGLLPTSFREYAADRDLGDRVRDACLALDWPTAAKPADLPLVVGTALGARVVLVDGDRVKIEHDMDFVEGMNDAEAAADHGGYVPSGEVWIDGRLARKSWPAVAAHEVYERARMLAGAPYAQAHAEANEVEKAMRLDAVAEFAAYDAGQPCKPGETAESTGCIPAKSNEKPTAEKPPRAPIGQPRKRSSIKEDFARQDIVKSLDEETRKGIERYASDEPGIGGVPPYADLNDRLRSGAALGKHDAEFAASLDRFIEAHGTFEKPITVYRGVGSMSSTERKGFIDMATRAKANRKLLKMKGFQSTSLDPEVAEDFAKGSQIVFEITTDRGALVDGLSPMVEEKEVLLGHDWKYEVEEIGETRQLVGKVWRGDPLTVIRLRVVR